MWEVDFDRDKISIYNMPKQIVIIILFTKRQTPTISLFMYCTFGYWVKTAYTIHLLSVCSVLAATLLEVLVCQQFTRVPHTEQNKKKKRRSKIFKSAFSHLRWPLYLSCFTFYKFVIHNLLFYDFLSLRVNNRNQIPFLKDKMKKKISLGVVFRKCVLQTASNKMLSKPRELL